MNTKAKGSRAERRARKMLEAAGYLVTKAGASLGVFDLIALGTLDVRCIQVKSGGAYLSRADRDRIAELRLPRNCSRECWRFPDHCRKPIIERIVVGA